MSSNNNIPDWFNLYWLTQLNRSSLSKGVVPRVCPICKNKLEESYLLLPRRDTLGIHHWGGDDLWESVRKGKYRRMCSSCNSTLGGFFKGKYPSSWDEQYEALTTIIPGWIPFHPSFDGKEGWWSLIDWDREIIAFLGLEGVVGNYLCCKGSIYKVSESYRDRLEKLGRDYFSASQDVKVRIEELTEELSSLKSSLKGLEGRERLVRLLLGGLSLIEAGERGKGLAFFKGLGGDIKEVFGDLLEGIGEPKIPQTSSFREWAAQSSTSHLSISIVSIFPSRVLTPTIYRNVPSSP